MTNGFKVLENSNLAMPYGHPAVVVCWRCSLEENYVWLFTMHAVIEVFKSKLTICSGTETRRTNGLTPLVWKYLNTFRISLTKTFTI